MNIVATFNLWRQEWLNGDKVEFDGATKRIYIHPEISTLVVRRDIYSAWKRWATLQENARYEQAIRTIGGDPIGGGQFAGDSYFLMNGWVLVIDHYVELEGILFNDVTGASPFHIIDGGGVVSRVSSLSQTIVQTVPVVTGDVTTLPSDVWAQAANTGATGSMGDLLRQVNTASQEVASSNTDLEATIDGMSTQVTELAEATSDIQTDVAAVLANLGAATDLINTLIKYDTNRTMVDQTEMTMTVFDDDGVTPLKVFDLRNFAGAPSVTEIAERVPR